MKIKAPYQFKDTNEKTKSGKVGVVCWIKRHNPPTPYAFLLTKSKFVPEDLIRFVWSGR